MGILDDAIREHLELKRKHGVPEDELERQEEEALGPARRDVAQQPEEADLPAGATATTEAEHDEPSAAEDEPVLFDMGAPEAATAPAEAPVEDQPPGGMEPPEPVEPELEPTAIDPPPVEPEPEPEPEPTTVEPPPV